MISIFGHEHLFNSNSTGNNLSYSLGLATLLEKWLLLGGLAVSLMRREKLKEYCTDTRINEDEKWAEKTFKF